MTLEKRPDMVRTFGSRRHNHVEQVFPVGRKGISRVDKPAREPHDPRKLRGNRCNSFGDLSTW